MNIELMEHKNPLVIYHANCADGFSAAWVFHHAGKERETAFDFHGGNYGENPFELLDLAGRHIYLVDFSYPHQVVEKMLEVSDGVTVIDHHKTAIDDLAPLTDKPGFMLYADIEKSGAMLAWDYMYNMLYEDPDLYSVTVHPSDPRYVRPPRLLEHVQDRDLWKFKLPNTREIQATVFSYEYTFENWDKLMSADAVELLQMTAAGAAIERKHFKDMHELLKQTKRMMTIGGVTVPVANLPYTFASDAGAALTREYVDGSYFAATYYDTADHRCFSLRSTVDVGMDVSLIAKEYGGGGHKHAAGFKVPRSHPLAQL